MKFGRKTLWTLVAGMVAVGGAIVAAANDGDEAPVEAAAPVTEAIAERDTTTTAEPDPLHDAAGLANIGSWPSTTTTTTTTTTAPPAPASTAPPAPAPTTTAPPAPPPPPPPPTTAPPPPPSGTPDSGCESYMYNQINANRSGTLAFDGGIKYVALNWSKNMAQSQNLAHNPSYGSQIGAVRSFSAAAENVGRGYELGSLFQAFMNSSGHRHNIQNQAYSHVTVGCVKDGSGQYWVTQNFWG